MKKKLIHVGSFGSPQGLKGDLRINILTTSLNSFKNLKKYFSDNGKSNLIFKSIKKIGNKYIGSLEGCDDRNTALEFKGKKIYSPKENFSKTRKGEYYVFELINCEIENLEHKFIGKIVDIKNYGAGDLIEVINSNKKTFYIPMNNENIVKIKIDKKKVIINPIIGLIE